MSRLYEEIGLVTSIIEPGSYQGDSDKVPYLAGSDNGTVKVEGYAGILFVLVIGDVAASVSVQVSLLAATTGQASDLAEPSWATDAVFSAATSDNNNTVELLDLSLSDFSQPAGGIIGASMTGDTDGAAEICLIAIPYGGNTRYPVTQTKTVKDKG